MSGIPSKDASFVWGTPRNYALTMKLLRITKLQAWIGVLAAFVWCFFDEWTKHSIPGRHYSTFDVMLNVIGVLLGWLMSRGRFWRHKENSLQ